MKMYIWSRKLAAAALLASALPAAAAAQLYGEAPDYKRPELYLKPGPQSAVDTAPGVLREEIGVSSSAAAGELVPAVFNWLAGGFKATAEGGRLIGKTTAAGLMKERRLSGCHDWALVFSAVLRRLGYPAIMADAAGIEWARGYKPGGTFSGHVFVEAYIGGRWTLIDSASGRYVTDYDPSNPVIPMAIGGETAGYYVMFKGTDPAVYGITTDGELGLKMKDFAARLPGLKLSYPEYEIKAPRSRAPRLGGAELAAPCQQEPCRSHPCRGVVLQAGGWDLLAEKKDGAYLVHHYRYGAIFRVPEERTESFSSLEALNAYLLGLSSAASR